MVEDLVVGLVEATAVEMVEGQVEVQRRQTRQPTVEVLAEGLVEVQKLERVGDLFGKRPDLGRQA